MTTLEELEAKFETCRNDIGELKVKIASLEGKVDLLLGKGDYLEKILKYVVTPLIILVGALVGIKLAIP